MQSSNLGTGKPEVEVFSAHWQGESGPSQRVQFPRAVRQQRSPVNVPLIWAAAGDGPSTPALDWMIRACEGIRGPVEFHEGTTQESEAARVSWSALRDVFRSWGIDNRELLTTRLRL